MHLRAFALPAVALTVLASGLVSTPASAAASCSSFGTDLHQLVQPSTGGSFVSVYASEVSSAGSRYGYTDTGVVAEVSGGAGSGLVAVQRFRKGADYVYATSTQGRSAALAAGYREESQSFYASATGGGSCSTPVWQVTMRGVHRLAVGAGDRDAMAAKGWADGGVVFYAAAGDSDPDTEPSSGPTSSAPAPSAPPSPSAPSSPSRPVPTGPAALASAGSDSDTTFSIAVVPDIQRETHTTSDHRIADRSEWLAANKAKLDLRFAAIVGDISDWDTPDHALYANAAQGLLPLQAAVPMAAVPGNHDTAAVCPGGSACPGAKTWVTVRDTTTYNEYFPKSRFSAMAGEFEAGKTDNAYHLFRAGGKDWMVINLELWPRAEVVTWAARLVAANPKRNVIVVTHSYLESNGKISTSNGGYGATAPSVLFEKVVKPYANVKLVLSGHTGSGAVRTDTTSKGTKVVSMLQCFHSDTTNPVRLIEIDTRAGSMKTWVYAPLTKQSMKQFDSTTTGLKFV